MKKILVLFLVAVGSISLASCAEQNSEIPLDFESNGGSKVEEIIINGTTIQKMPDNPVREGYDFGGWFWDDGTFEEPLTTNSLLDASLSSNLIVYAKWIEQAPNDSTAPTFEGIDHMTIYVGDGFQPLEGVSAYDDVDGDVTSNISFTGNVDTTNVGSFIMTYVVSDSSGNRREVIRRITVEQGELTNTQKVEEAADILILGGLNNVQADILLPFVGKHNTTITWTSSHPDIISNMGEVTRPIDEEGNVLVTLTAMISLDEASVTKEFVANVLAMDPTLVFETVAELHESSVKDDLVEFKGIVSSVFNNGYFLTDGLHAICVYGQLAESIQVGDEVHVKGTYASYYSLHQISDLTFEEIYSRENLVTLPVVDVTMEELVDLDSSNKLLNGQHYSITGRVELRGEYNNIWLVSNDVEVVVFYQSLDQSIAALETLVGQTVTIQVVYYVNHPVDGVRVVFQGDVSDITIIEE